MLKVILRLIEISVTGMCEIFQNLKKDVTFFDIDTHQK